MGFNSGFKGLKCKIPNKLNTNNYCKLSEKSEISNEKRERPN